MAGEGLQSRGPGGGSVVGEWQSLVKLWEGVWFSQEDQGPENVNMFLSASSPSFLALSSLPSFSPYPLTPSPSLSPFSCSSFVDVEGGH